MGITDGLLVNTGTCDARFRSKGLMEVTPLLFIKDSFAIHAKYIEFKA